MIHSQSKHLLLCMMMLLSLLNRAQAEDPPSPEEIERIVEFVQQTQKAGYEKHDLETYLSSWAENATFVGGRNSKPHQYDITLSRQQIEDTRKILFGGPAIKDVRLQFFDTQSEFKDDLLTIEWTVEIAFPRARQKTGERYEMRQTDDGWKISKNRSWIISYQPTDRPDLPITRYNEAKWKRADRKVEELNSDPSATAIDRVYALWDAARHVEAYSLICQEIEQTVDDPDLWYWRGISAFQLGKVEDSRKSLVKAVELNPDLEAPFFSPEDLKTPIKSRDEAR